MTPLSDIVARGFCWVLGWSRVPRALQEQIDFVLDHLPESMDDNMLVIHRLAPWRLSLISGPTCAAFGWALAQEGGTYEAAWTVGGAAFGVAFAFAMLSSSPLMLVLDASGVCFVYRDCEITCPWSLFAASGEPVHYRLTLVVPTNADAISDVKLRRHGQLVGFGGEVRMPAFSFVGDSQLKLGNTLELASPILGMLIQELAFALTTQQSDVAATETERVETGVPPDSLPVALSHSTTEFNIGVVENGQRITLPVTRLQFPPECCNCDQPTSEEACIEAPTRYRIFRSKRFLYFNIPCCRRCRRLATLRSWAGGIVGLSVALATAIAVTFAILGPPSEKNSLFWILAGAFAILPTIWAVDAGRWCVSRTNATYFQESECVLISFRQPGYAERVRDFHRRYASQA